MSTKLNFKVFLLVRGFNPEVHKVPEPGILVRRKYLKISLLAENFKQIPRIESTETFLSQVYYILTENLLFTLFSRKQLILEDNFFIDL